MSSAMRHPFVLALAFITSTQHPFWVEDNNEYKVQAFAPGDTDITVGDVKLNT